MPLTYYAIRRCCPYLGVIQVIDVGEAAAYSTDGQNWKIRSQTPSGRFRWGGAVVDSAEGVKVHGDANTLLMKAIRERPEIPFPIMDRYELWLLRKSSLQPLVLLKTCMSFSEVSTHIDPSWNPILSGDTSFVSPVLTEEDAHQHPRAWKVPHKDQLEHLIHEAGRPMPVAHWIRRNRDGSGSGLKGLRVDKAMEGRHYEAVSFPEMLVDEHWKRERDRLVVQDFHDWSAARLLAHQSLKNTTRARLEQAAWKRPDQVLENHAMYPEVIDTEALEVALVSARLMQCSA